AEDARRDGVKGLLAPVAVRDRRLAEAKPRREQLDFRACARERRRELVVVLRRERGWIGENDTHGGRTVVLRCWSEAGTSTTATPLRPGRAPTSRRWSGWSPTAPTSCCSRRCRRGRSDSWPGGAGCARSRTSRSS